KDLPEWGLRAEFWVEEIGDRAGYANESGAYFYLSTDQVRFYEVDTSPSEKIAGRSARVAGLNRAEADPGHPIACRRLCYRKSFGMSTCSSVSQASATTRPGPMVALTAGILITGTTSASATWVPAAKRARMCSRNSFHA